MIGEELSGDLAAVITSLLSSAPLTDVMWPFEPEAFWLDTGHVKSRVNVWSAVGLLMASAGLNQVAGLAGLRAYAFSHDAAINDVASRRSRQ